MGLRSGVNQRNEDEKSQQQGKNGAGNGSRTRDFQLGKLTLCQLSYARSER